MKTPVRFRPVSIIPFGIAAFALACGLSASQWEQGAMNIVVGGVKLACSATVDYVPSTDRTVTTKVCTGLDIGADVLKNIIDVAAGEAKASHLIQPQGEAPPRPAQCAGRNVTIVPARIAERVQKRLDEREECKK